MGLSYLVFFSIVEILPIRRDLSEALNLLYLYLSIRDLRLDPIAWYYLAVSHRQVSWVSKLLGILRVSSYSAGGPVQHVVDAQHA